MILGGLDPDRNSDPLSTGYFMKLLGRRNYWLYSIWSWAPKNNILMQFSLVSVAHWEDSWKYLPWPVLVSEIRLKHSNKVSREYRDPHNRKILQTYTVCKTSNWSGWVNASPETFSLTVLYNIPHLAILMCGILCEVINDIINNSEAMILS